MKMLVIGIDPDSSKHGVAIYQNNKLIELYNWELMQVYDYLLAMKGQIENIVFSIEDVNKTKAVWHGKQQSKAAFGMTSQNVAKCKQAQIELERMLDYVGVKYIKQKISKAWKEDKKQFELVTGWAGRSNEDNRSAAYMGFLALAKHQ